MAMFVLGLYGCAVLGRGGDGGGARLGKPDWVGRGPAFVVDGKDRKIVAVGQALDKLRAPLLKKIAERKAKDAIKEPLKAYLKALAGPWLASLGPEALKEGSPTRMLDALLGRLVPMAAVDEVFLTADDDAAYAQSRIDLMAVLMEMQSSTDVEPLMQFLNANHLDANALFDQMAAGKYPPPKAVEPPPDKAGNADSTAKGDEKPRDEKVEDKEPTKP
jgi:hypothetical protein